MADDLKLFSAEDTEPAEVMEKVRVFVRMNIMNAGILLICLIFVATAVLRPERTDMTIEEVVLGSLLAFIASMGINSLYTSKAIKDGLLRPEMVTAKANYNQAVDGILDENLTEDLETYCKTENEKNYRKQRTRILSAAGLLYADCFDECGAPKEVSITVPRFWEMRGVSWRLRLHYIARAKKQIRAYTKACTLRLAELTADELLGEDGNSRNPFKLGRKIPVFRGQSVSRDAVSKTVTGIGLGFYGAAMIADFEWMKLVSMIFQVVIFNVIGILKYLSTVTYVTEEYQGRLVKMTRIITKFKKGADRNSNEVQSQLGSPDQTDSGAGERDRELHAAASANI